MNMNLNSTLKWLLIGALLGSSLSVSAQTPDKVAVAIGQRGLWDTLIVYQGIEAGIFADENIDVDMTWTRGGAETLQAVTTRSVDIGIVNGTTGVLGAYKRGAPVRIVGAQMTGADDLFWYTRADSGIKGLDDLAGKRVGFSRPGASTHLVLLALLQDAGVDARTVSAGGIADNRTQVMSGQLDVGWSAPPFNLDLVEQGQLRIIGKGSDLPTFSEQTVRVNISNTTFLKNRRDVAMRFMRAYMRTVDWMYEHRDTAIERFAKFNDIELSIAREAANFYPKQTLLSLPVKGMDQTMRDAIEQGTLREPLTGDELNELMDFVYDPR